MDDIETTRDGSLGSRLKAGRPGWKLQLTARCIGLGLLFACWRAAHLVERLVATAPHGQAPPAAYAVCLLAVVLLTAGLALVMEGARLLRHAPIPPHSAFA